MAATRAELRTAGQIRMATGACDGAHDRASGRWVIMPVWPMSGTGAFTIGSDPGSAGTELAQEPQDLDVEPEQPRHEPECGVPLHVPGCAHLGTALDEIEIEEQGEGGYTADHEAEADAEKL